MESVTVATAFIPRYKPYTRKQASTRLNWKRDRLEKAEFQPDNSQIGKQVQAATVQIPPAILTGTVKDTKKQVMQLLFNDLGISGYLKLSAGIVHSTMVIGRTLPSEQLFHVEHTKFIGPETEKQYRANATRQVVKGQPVSGWMLESLAAQSKKQQGAGKENKQTWKPKVGQRPQVMLQSSK